MTSRLQQLGGWGRALLGFILALAFVLPLYWMFVTSVKSGDAVLEYPPPVFPWPGSFEPYLEAWTKVPMARYALNNVIVTGAILLLQLPLVSMAAYGFARFNFKGKRALFTLVLLSMMIPGQATFLPNFILVKQLGWYDQFAALILPFASSAYGIFLLRQAFLQVPQDLINAAQLDGANQLQVLWHVLLPIVKPTVVTIALFSFVSHWNAYFWPLVATSSDAVRTLPVGVAMLRDGDARMSWNVLMAGNMTVVMPVLLVFLIFQRNIVRSFIQGSMK